MRTKKDSKEVAAKDVVLSPYKIWWAIFTPITGRQFVPVKDQKKMGAIMLHKKEAQEMKHFASKDLAVAFAKSLEGKLSKRYNVEFCTDKQFGDGVMQNGCLMIDFTNKQKKESFVI